MGRSPAVRIVFFILSIILLSPEACKRTLVRSSGLLCRKVNRSRKGDDRQTYCVIEAAIVAARPPSQKGYGFFFAWGFGDIADDASCGVARLVGVDMIAPDIQEVERCVIY